MAGSLNHIVDHETGGFRMGGIDHIGDAYEALDECFKLIYALTGGDKNVINNRMKELGLPSIKCNMTLGGESEL